VSANPETRESAESYATVHRRIAPRLLALAVVIGILAVLGVGALADTLAVAPLRPPSQAGESQQAGIYTLALSMKPEPLTAGAETTFTLLVTDVSGAPVHNAHVTCDFTMPAMPMPKMLIVASEDGAGRYTCHETLTDPGAWAMTATLTPPDAPGGAPVHTTFTLQAR
jgi:hypothetical protein